MQIISGLDAARFRVEGFGGIASLIEELRAKEARTGEKVTVEIPFTTPGKELAWLESFLGDKAIKPTPEEIQQFDARCGVAASILTNAPGIRLTDVDSFDELCRELGIK